MPGVQANDEDARSALRLVWGELMFEYPKIETVFNRDPVSFKVIFGQVRKPEFAIVNTWLVTEKLDGTNIRIRLCGNGVVEYSGRTISAQLHPQLLQYLQTAFPAEKVAAAFDPNLEVILFGEGYGPKIQCGSIYRKDISFRLFDVAVRPAISESQKYLWLEWASVVDIAGKLGIATVFDLGVMDLSEAVDHVQTMLSPVALMENDSSVPAEGIVARTVPLLFDRWGNRVMWKLKRKDFAGGRG